MSIAFRCSNCNTRLKAGGKMAGKKLRCVKCGESILVPADTQPATAPQPLNEWESLTPALAEWSVPPPLPVDAIETVPLADEPPQASSHGQHGGGLSYKVLTQKDKWFTRKFDPMTLEQAINAYATEGWRVSASVTAAIPGVVTTNREEIIFVLQRQWGQPMFEYKVLTQKDKWFTRKFDPKTLEQAINAYAGEGWRVATCATASFTGFLSGHRDEMILILERPVEGHA